jgi:hypothetical protein
VNTTAFIDPTSSYQTVFLASFQATFLIPQDSLSLYSIQVLNDSNLTLVLGIAYFTGTTPRSADIMSLLPSVKEQLTLSPLYTSPPFDWSIVSITTTQSPTTTPISISPTFAPPTLRPRLITLQPAGRVHYNITLYIMFNYYCL